MYKNQRKENITHLPGGKMPDPGKTLTKTATHLLSQPRRSQIGTIVMREGFHTTSLSPVRQTVTNTNIKMWDIWLKLYLNEGYKHHFKFIQLLKSLPMRHNKKCNP